MSHFHVDTNHISQKKFVDLPRIGEIAGFIQAPSSIEGGSASDVSEVSTNRGNSLQEGDLVTGIVDIANQHVHMVSMAHNADHAHKLGEYLLSLEIIPQDYRLKWDLNHDSNKTWLSPSFHYHHDIYATVLIAPSIKDSRLIGNCLNSDNLPRLESAIHGKGDPGRTAGRDWFLGVSYKYELIILHPSHFLMDNSYVVIKHPSTGHPTAFYASNDGFLHEGSPTGPRLPPFGSRGIIDREIPLNPILVSFAAKLRLRRLDHQIPGWRTRLHPEAQEVLAGVDKVHKATVWEPEPLLKAYNARKRAPLQGLHPQLTRQGVYPTMRWEDAMKLIHSDFQDLPDLGGENSSPKHPDLDSDLGVMTNEEKIEKFLAGSQ